MGLFDRIQHAWNAFRGIDPPSDEYMSRFTYAGLGPGYPYMPDRVVLKKYSERSIVSAIYSRIAIDCSSINIKHVQLDEDGRYSGEVDSTLNECFKLQANLDQAPRTFIQDVVMTMFDEGHVAIVPTVADVDPETNEEFDVEEYRVGRILEYYPDEVKVEIYNNFTGKKVERLFKKKSVAIIYNPLFSVMNEPNSTLQRLIHKLALLDVVDEQSSSGKLDLIIQLPYMIKSDEKRKYVQNRRTEIENQLRSSKYGIAYTDGTEKVTQLNRPIGNNLMEQVIYLTSMLYSQLGMTDKVLDGTADEKEMLNYKERTIRPIMDAIVDEMKRKFLSKKKRTEEKQSIMYFDDPFRLVPVQNIADIADKFTRNEILSPNEIRQIVGFMPVTDPAADELRNRNINATEGQENANTEKTSGKKKASGAKPGAGS